MQGYELVERSVVDGIDVATLRQEVTGGLYQVYAFPAGLMREYEDLCQQVESVPRQISKVVSIARDITAGYFMTEVLPEGTNLRDWIHHLAAPSAGGAAVESASQRLFHLALEMRDRRVSDDLTTTGYRHAAASSIAATPALYRDRTPEAVAPTDDSTVLFQSGEAVSGPDDNTVFFQSGDDLPQVAGLAEAATLLFAQQPPRK